MALLERVTRLLSGLGIAVENVATTGSPSPLRLSRGSFSQTYSATVAPIVDLSTVAATRTSDLPVLILTAFVAPRTAEALRRAGVQYVDAAGNAWLEFGQVLIDVRGRPRPKDLESPEHHVGNLFSAGRSQVAFALLSWPELWESGSRALARAAGVSVGLAHSTAKLLADGGYRETGRHGRASLIDLWAAAYPTGLATKLWLADFHGDHDQVRVPPSGDQVFVSGEHAVKDQLRPSTLTIYVPDLDPRLPIVNRWRTDGPPNVTVRRKFWQAPDAAEQSLPSVGLAPWPLIYADLAASDDPRVVAIAGDWRDRHVRSNPRT